MSSIVIEVRAVIGLGAANYEALDDVGRVEAQSPASSTYGTMHAS